MALRFLVVEGNTRDARQQHAATYGMAPSESYAVVVAGLASDAICDIAAFASAFCAAMLAPLAVFGSEILTRIR